MRIIGSKGELSKIDEEVEELKDAYNNEQNVLCIIEAADIIESVQQFISYKYYLPSFLLFILYYIRRLYKPIRNLIRDILGLSKT